MTSRHVKDKDTSLSEEWEDLRDAFSNLGEALLDALVAFIPPVIKILPWVLLILIVIGVIK